ncbi:hypothetical protein Csa_012400 [Cucumis sativus]|uniref:Uncharacterized protein n=1 Tax=Cucumis sativus TaxID=3659 RepID=A0A0A0L3I5_CUCSA|nr:hypothetical protein Csa_012400 [Cucumis sativus]
MSTPSIKLISTFVAILILSSTFHVSHTQARMPPTKNLDRVEISKDLHPKIEETVAVAPLKSEPLAFDRDTFFTTSNAEVLGGDFRPTTPGHSPGAGHSVAPTSHMDSKIH